MFLKFDLKKVNTSGLTYKDDGQILSSKIKDGVIINSNIIFTKPYKIQVRASKMINGKRIQSKKIMVFNSNTTLLDAIKKASKVYENLMNELSVETYIKQEFTPDMSYNKVYQLYLEYKVAQYEARDDKKEFSRKKIEQFHNKWLKSILNKPIGMIDEEDIHKIVSSIKRAGFSERTSRFVYQYVNPIFKYFNMKAAKFGINIPSPALQRDLPPLNNERGLELTLEEIKDLFKELKDYPISPVREIFMFLMHGRRFGEVVTLEWADINFEENTYTVRALNNKARVDMIYHLSKRLKDVLENIGIKNSGYVFTKINNKNEPYSIASIRNHWNNKPIVLHQIRNCIATYLKNKMGIGDDVTGAILGHKQNKTITSRYGKINYYSFGKVIDNMLDEIFGESMVVSENLNEKIEIIKSLFPDKDEKTILKIIELLK
ncbi:tyrosine-type recombinase/integrase [Aliarcobacter butzleri]|uniref:tyrosine-type recombinase/integrase n=1 Tax=Aliarcobacter butzleri TaxID=28197 RepID=UPI002B23F4F5|nr:tyrosine-type recombinase/integrase [Aliarcobacter butzleri]